MEVMVSEHGAELYQFLNLNIFCVFQAVGEEGP